MNDQLKVTTNEQAWEYLQRAKQNLGEEAMKPEISNPEYITIPCLVTECDELSNDGSVDLLLGMNVISKGDFVISNNDGQTVMTFRVPSLESVDFVKEIDEYNKILKIHDIESRKGIERCPCKSGKAFKNCHGKSVYHGK